MSREIIKHWTMNAIQAFFVTVPVLMLFSVIWFVSIWSTMTVNELLYHLFSPLEGTGDSVIQSFVVRCAIPAIVVWLVITVIFHFIAGYKKIKATVGVFAALILVFDITFFLGEIDFYNYITTLKNGSRFIEDNYVDPSQVDISFPENKRNLVYIFLESMEVSYSNVSHGGAFEYNVIPELTELASEGECFSGNQQVLNGAYSFPGTDWTAAGIIAHTSGLPVQVQMGQRGDWAEDVYYPTAVALGDILQDNGYRQYFMCGSDAEFGGRKQYLTAHGNYEIDDYNYAVDRGWVDPAER